MQVLKMRLRDFQFFQTQRQQFGDVWCVVWQLKKYIKLRYPCYRPWRPIRLRDVKAPTLLRQTANRWRQGCHPYAPTALYPRFHYF
jgi:hypothetical protein